MFVRARRLTAAAILMSFVVAAPRARASDEADALFAQGRELLEKGRYLEACDKLRLSEELSPAVGTLLDLGFCYEQLGRLRSAMDAYAEAEILAERAKDDKRAAFARERFSAVEPRVMKIVLRVAGADTPGLEVARNGTPVPRTDWDKPIPVDPDDFVFTATAPGHVGWRSVVQGRGEGAVLTVIVPPLAELPRDSAGGRPEANGTSRIVALALGGAGAAALGAGAALALSAKSRHDDSLHHCDDAGCDEVGAGIQEGAVAQGNVATALVVFGVLCAGAGTYLWLSSGPSTPSSPKAALRFTPAGVGARF